MRTTTAIDWLSYTIKKPLPGKRVYPDFCHTEGHEVKGNLGYTYGWEMGNGIRILSNPDRPEMGYHVIMSGKALQRLASDGWDLWRLVMGVLSLGAKIKRIDLALDIHDSDEQVSTFVDAYRDGKARTKTRSFHEIKGRFPEDGHTAYFGSRQSERMVRVYDKAAQTGLLPFSWLRVEAEIKGKKAHGIASHLSEIDREQRTGAIHGVIQQIVDFPTIPAWRNALDAIEVDLAPAQRKDTDTRDWLLNTCARSLAKHIAREEPEFMTLFAEAVDIWREKYDNEDS